MKKAEGGEVISTAADPKIFSTAAEPKLFVSKPNTGMASSSIAPVQSREARRAQRDRMREQRKQQNQQMKIAKAETVYPSKKDGGGRKPPRQIQPLPPGSGSATMPNPTGANQAMAKAKGGKIHSKAMTKSERGGVPAHSSKPLFGKK
jgi:hypothetical protein